jgi:hypothetical protein
MGGFSDQNLLQRMAAKRWVAKSRPRGDPRRVHMGQPVVPSGVHFVSIESVCVFSAIRMATKPLPQTLGGHRVDHRAAHVEIAQIPRGSFNHPYHLGVFTRVL